MNTFELPLSETTWTEALNGGAFLAFGKLEDAEATFLFTTVATSPNPATEGNRVATWPQSWDFEAFGLEPGVQRIWLKGKGTIRGVRG